MDNYCYIFQALTLNYFRRIVIFVYCSFCVSQSRINGEAATALSTDPRKRTAAQRHAAHVSLRTTVKAFSEMPLGMQESLVTVGTYHRYNTTS